jgi:hypothetical protein
MKDGAIRSLIGNSLSPLETEKQARVLANEPMGSDVGNVLIEGRKYQGEKGVVGSCKERVKQRNRTLNQVRPMEKG